MTTLIEQLTYLSERSEAAWDACLESVRCERSERALECRDDRDDALAHWEAALDEAEAGDYESARSELEDARICASEWGEDSFERAALELLEPRTAEQWWAWHDQDSSRWSSEQSDADTRCAAWVAGDSDDGPGE